VPILKQKSYLPVVVDPSHGTGIRNIVEPMALAAAMSGADGVIMEIHEEPEKAFPTDSKRSRLARRKGYSTDYGKPCSCGSRWECKIVTSDGRVNSDG